MKVTLSTPERLEIEDRPLLLWVMLYGMGGAALFSALLGQVDGALPTLIVLALGAGAIWVAWKMLPYQHFTLDRTAGEFRHRVKRVTGTQNWTRQLDDIERATDEGHWSEGNRLERVTLITSTGPYPLEAGFTGSSRKPVIQAINDWLGV